MESIRHDEGALLSRTKKPSGGDQGASLLIKRAVHAWGCDRLGLDLLPKNGARGTYGPEAAAAVKQVQLFSGLSTDGVVGPRTLEALDLYLGVVILPSPPTPGSVGGSKTQGNSIFRPGSRTVGQIFFATDDATLDYDDHGVLFAMAEAARDTESIELVVTGFADKRESGEHNIGLADDRASRVNDSLDTYLSTRGVDYAVSYEPFGEIERPQRGETDEELKPFRRADVIIASATYPEGPDVCDNLLCVPEGPVPLPRTRCDEPVSEFTANLRNVSVWGEVGVLTNALVDIKTTEADSKGRKWHITYAYGGVGFGAGLKIPKIGKSLPGSIGIKTDPEPFTTSAPIKPTDFKGDAIYGTVALVPGGGVSHEHLRMEGPEDAGADEVFVQWDGWSVGLSGGASQDVSGSMKIFAVCREI